MKKISKHDEREIKDYVKYNPNSFKSVVSKKMKLDKPSKGNADKSPRTAKADY